MAFVKIDPDGVPIGVGVGVLQNHGSITDGRPHPIGVQLPGPSVHLSVNVPEYDSPGSEPQKFAESGGLL